MIWCGVPLMNMPMTNQIKYKISPIISSHISEAIIRGLAQWRQGGGDHFCEVG